MVRLKALMFMAVATALIICGCSTGGGHDTTVISGGAANSQTGAGNLPPPIPQKNLIELHKEGASTLSDAHCTTCHGPMTNETAQGYGPHKKHIENVGLGCTYCHKSIDLGDGTTTVARTGSAGNLRRQVAVAICANCHSGPPNQWYLTRATLRQDGGQ